MKSVNIKNNKAEINIYEHEVVKKYFDSNRNEQEYRTLSTINSLFEEKIYEDWKYSFVKVKEGSKEGGIVMERVLGDPMAEDKEFDEDNYYHLGVWLGYFHSLSRKENEVKAFYDYTISNIYINYNEKKIIGLDPGSDALSIKTYYFDILKLFYSTVTAHIKRKKLYNTVCVHKFVEGYNVFGKFIFDPILFKEALDEVLLDAKSPSRINKYGKIRFYVGYFLIVIYLKFGLKKKLQTFICAKA